MQMVQATKRAVKEALPELWLRWHFSRRPQSAERELLYLRKMIPMGSVTVDVGANCGLYTRELSKLSRLVHAFEPSRDMATLLRRTSASNVMVHEIACSDREGNAALFIPEGKNGLVHGLASIEHSNSDAYQSATQSIPVSTARLDKKIDQEVSFVKVDVEGHELSVLRGAVGLIKAWQPVFLVEAEDRHREEATASIFQFFREWSYRGFFLDGDRIASTEDFDAVRLQDPTALLSDGGRVSGRSYVNNFFFFPPHMNGDAVLRNAAP